ncbi:hypothetical protein Tco_0304450 [Tanacetum coccineum]
MFQCLKGLSGSYRFVIISNPLFEFDDSFKSSNVNPLFEEKDKDVKIKSSSSFTLTSPKESEFEAYSIPPGIDLTLPPTFEVSSSNLTSPTLTGEKKPKPLSQEVEEIKEKEDEISSEIPIHTIVMPIRITFDNPIDFNDHFSKPKDFKKDLTVKLDSNESSILQPPLLDSGSPFTAELSASVTLNSLGETTDKYSFQDQPNKFLTAVSCQFTDISNITRKPVNKRESTDTRIQKSSKAEPESQCLSQKSAKKNQKIEGLERKARGLESSLAGYK